MKYDDLIIKFLDGRLGADKEESFRKQLESDSELRTRFEEIKELGHELKALNDVEADSAYFESLTVRAKERMETATDKPGFLRMLVPAAAAIVVIFSLAVIFNLSLQNASNSSEVIYAEENYDVNDMIENYTNGYYAMTDVLGNSDMQLTELDSAMVNRFAVDDVKYDNVLNDFETGYTDLLDQMDSEDIAFVYNEIKNY